MTLSLYLTFVCSFTLVIDLKKNKKDSELTILTNEKSAMKRAKAT